MRNQYLENIADLIVEYAKLQKPIDNAFIVHVINNIINGKELQEYVNKYQIIEVPNGIQYMPLTKSIAFYLTALKNCKKRNTFAEYFYVVRIALKELEHSNQLKNCKNNINSLDTQTQILKICYEKYINLLFNRSKNENLRKNTYQILKHDNIYCKYTNMAPEERYAEIESYNKIETIIDLMGINYQDIVSLNALDKLLIEPYRQLKTNAKSKIFSPTLFYLEQLSTEKSELKTITENSKALDLNTRIELGLELTEEEFNKLIRTKETPERIRSA